MSELDSLTRDDLVETFAFLDDWEERYAYLIDLGKRLPAMPETTKTETVRVQGCMSQVWLIPQPQPDGRFGFLADSDAVIVRGLIAILRVLFHNQPRDVVAALDIEAVFTELGLDEHLSPNRRNGFMSMVDRIRQLAALG